MANESITQIKTYFNKGDKPTEAQYVNLIDTLSQILYSATRAYIAGEPIIIDNSGYKLYLCATDTVAGESPITTPSKWELAGGGSGGLTESSGNTFSTALDFTLDGADYIFYDRGTQSGDLTFTITNNPIKSNVFIRTSFETDGNNIILPSVIEKSLVANEYTNDVGIYFLLIHWDGDDFVSWITRIRDVDVIAPTITGFTLETSNTYVDVDFSEGVYGANDGVSPVLLADLKISNFIADGATSISISSIEKVGGGALIGGETQIRCNLSITGTASGSETFEIQPFDGASIYDSDGNVMSSAQTTGTITLYDEFTLQAITVTDNVGLTVSAGVSGTNIQKTGATELWDSGCASVEVINSGIGWIEFRPKKVNNTAYGMIVGLSDSNPNANETQIDYGLLVLSDDIYKIENNSSTLLNTAGSADGQTFRVKMTPSGGSNAIVTYEWKVSGIWEVLGTSAVVATYPLLMDCSLIRDGASNVNQVTVEEIGFKGVDIV